MYALGDPSVEMVGMIHSHPDLGDWENDFHSEADLFLLNLPGIEEVYVVPYKPSDPYNGSLVIIVASDVDSWDFEGHDKPGGNYGKN